jgi:DNA-binding NarL/FixJ family response regulator
VAKQTIVLVDDHPSLRLALKTILEDTGEFDIVGEASTGDKALAIIRRVPPSLVIVDLKLPDIDGIELIRQVRRAAPSTRILVFSSQDERMHAGPARDAGGHGFVGKDRDICDILTAARLVLAGYNCFADSGTEATTDRLGQLSPRELTILKGLVAGASNKQLADTLFLSPKTVSTHKTRMLRKLNLETLVDLVEFAKAHRLIE